MTDSIKPVKEFFESFGEGNMVGISDSFHDNCRIVAVRAVQRSGSKLYGTYLGREGLKEFLSNLGNTFETKDFIINHLIGQENIVFASGTFTHYVRATGKPFYSAWSLMCIIEQEKIKEYHFYEDSAALIEASI